MAGGAAGGLSGAWDTGGVRCLCCGSRVGVVGGGKSRRPLVPLGMAQC